MSSTRTARVLLEYEVNQQSARKAEESAKQVQRGLTGLTQAEKDVAKANQLSARTAFELEKGFNATSKSIATTEQIAERMNRQLFALARQKAVDTLAGDFVAMEKQAGGTAAALEMVAKRLREIGASDNEINRVVGQIVAMEQASAKASAAAGGTSAGRGLQRAGMALFNAPAIGASTPIARGLIMVGNLADKTGASMTQLAGVFGIGAAAALAFALVMENKWNASIQSGKKALEGAIAGQNAYYTALADLNASEIRERVADLQRIQAIRAQQISEATGALESAFAQAQANFSDPVARLLDNQLPTAQLREQLEGLQSQSRAADSEIARLTQGLEAGTFAAISAAEAEQRLAEQRTAAFQATLQGAERSAMQDLDNLRLLRTATGEQVRELIARTGEEEEAYRILVGGAALNVAALEARIEAERAAVEQFGGTIAELEALEAQLVVAQSELSRLNPKWEELTEQQEELRGILTVIIQKEQERAKALRMSEQTDQLFEFQTRLVQSYEEATKAYQAITDLNNQTNARLAEIEADRIQKRADAEAKAADDLATAQADADEKKVEALKQYEEEKQRIERSYLSSRNKAIAERDAVALLDARQKRKEDLADLDDKLKKQEEAIDKAYDKQKKAIEKRLDEQLKAIEKANGETLRKEADRYKQELAIRQQAHQAAIVSAMNIENQLAAIRNNAASGRVIAEYQLYSDIYQNARFWLTSIAQFIAGGLGGAGGYLQGVATGKTPGGVGKANYAANVGVTVNAGGDARQIARIAAAAAEKATYKTMRTAMTQSGVIGGR